MSLAQYIILNVFKSIRKIIDVKSAFTINCHNWLLYNSWWSIDWIECVGFKIPMQYQMYLFLPHLSSHSFHRQLFFIRKMHIDTHHKCTHTVVVFWLIFKIVSLPKLNHLISSYGSHLILIKILLINIMFVNTNFQSKMNEYYNSSCVSMCVCVWKMPHLIHIHNNNNQF